MSATRFIAAGPRKRLPDLSRHNRSAGIGGQQRRHDAFRWRATNLHGLRLVPDLVWPLLLGVGCALAAWSPGYSPAVGLLFPMLWALSASRLAAFLFAAAYAMTVVRFLPGFAGYWFGSPALGLVCWISVGIVSGGLWGLLWPRRSAALHVSCATLAALLLSLLPPVGALFPGHPVVCLGFALPGSGWVGVAALAVGTVAATAVLSFFATLPRGSGCAHLVVAGAALALAWFGVVPEPDGGPRTGKVVGITTEWGGFPPFGSVEVVKRLQRVGETLDARAAEGALTLVYPEAIIGLYDTSLDDVIELEIVNRIRRTGQTVVLGADVNDAGGRFRNIALVLRPDGSRSTLSARQTTPFAQWRPWSSVMHFPADWLAGSTVGVGHGLRARIMFCHEEWMPVLHLITEFREDHLIVIAMANLSAAENSLASHVQGAHTQGMAVLFGRQFVRAVNHPAG